jgi:hypothetical protein
MLIAATWASWQNPPSQKKLGLTLPLPHSGWFCIMIGYFPASTSNNTLALHYVLSINPKLMRQFVFSNTIYMCEVMTEVPWSQKHQTKNIKTCMSYSWLAVPMVLKFGELVLSCNLQSLYFPKSSIVGRLHFVHGDDMNSPVAKSCNDSPLCICAVPSSLD